MVEGEFRPGGQGREWCDTDVLRTVRRRSLAALRKEVEPVEPHVLGRFLTAWHGLVRPRAGLDALLDVVERLQGAPLVASVLEREVLPARVHGYRPALLDTLVSAGEVTWLGVEPLGERDGRIALYLTDHLRTLAGPASTEGLSEHHSRAPGRAAPQRRVVLRAAARRRRRRLPARDRRRAVGPGLERAGHQRHAASRCAASSPARCARGARPAPTASARAGSCRRRRKAAGRPCRPPGRASATAWATALTQQLLTRHGVVARDVTAIEPVPGGFSTIYPVLRRLEDTGRVRRGYFVAGLGGAQFAEPGAVDLLRAERDPSATPAVVTLAATDPANPYGALVEWPAWGGSALKASRVAGARVVLVDGHAVCWIGRGDRQLLVAVPDAIRIARRGPARWPASWCGWRTPLPTSAVAG